MLSASVRLLVVSPCLVLVLAAHARAQGPCSGPPNMCPGGQTTTSIVDTDSFGPVFPQWSSRSVPSVPRLAVGKLVLGPGQTLIQVDVTVVSTLTGDQSVENRDPLNSCIADLAVAGQLQIAPANPIPGLVFPPVFLTSTRQLFLAAFDGIVDFAGPSGAIVSYPPLGNTSCVRLTDPVALASFVGSPGEMLEFSHSASSSSSLSGCAPVTFLIDDLASISVSVEYTVCSGPVPPTASHDSLAPASLLLFPEYDNRAGANTLLTITNVSCDVAAEDVDVELRYISEETCVEFYRTERLTPCDTLSVLTKFHAPGQKRGYVYAFARHPVTGQAISSNTLAGQAIVLDGTGGLSWSTNAIGFTSPLPAGASTDLDSDDVRDLDGAEYAMVPDRLVIPRFLGQGAFSPQTGPYPGQGSTLTLIGLSGGRQFTTIVELLVANDNEQIFSREVTFYCWYKAELADISPLFTEAFLDSTANDPTEIFGWNREAGWIRVDGRVAHSAVETIVDPAVYALLVETQRDGRVADLPWRIGSQENGDLLPFGVLGDPRPGAPGGLNGDNQ